MARDMNLTGRWVGNYFMHGHARPIAADLVQKGEQLTGSMRDGVTDSGHSLFEFAAEAGYPRRGRAGRGGTAPGVP